MGVFGVKSQQIKLCHVQLHSQLPSFLLSCPAHFLSSQQCHLSPSATLDS